MTAQHEVRHTTGGRAAGRPARAEAVRGAYRPHPAPAPAPATLQRRLDAWASTGADWLWEAAPDGRFTFSAPQVNHCGYQPDECTGLSLADLLHADERPRLRSLLAAGQGWRDQLWHCVAKDGSDVWLRGSAVADLDVDGTVLGYIGTAQLVHEADDVRHAREVRSRRLHRVIGAEELDIVFQPIVGADSGRLVGAEALTRFRSPAPRPDVVFAEAHEVGLGVDLELLAVRQALRAATALPEDVYVSVNLSPRLVRDPRLRAAVTRGPVDPSRVVLEITEHESIGDYEVVGERLRPLREAGVRVAVDDAGAGFASFTHILRLRPEYIKLDQTLVTGIDSDPARRALAGAVVMLALELGAHVVAEGVETVAELRAAQVLSIDAVQGFFLGRPTSDWATLREWHAHGRLFRLAGSRTPDPA